MLKNNIRIETASCEDANAILKVQKEAFLGQATIYNNKKLPPITQSLKSIESEFNDKIFLKAIFENQIIASVRYQTTDKNVTIDRIVVIPECQNQGVGSILLREIEKRNSNAISFQLFTGSKSKRNIYLYKKLGYKIIATQVTNQGIELLHMEKIKTQQL